MKDIALQAGVSNATVSRALKGNAAISSRTRERILKIAEELHYVPNQAAQKLVGRQKDHSAYLRPFISIVFESGITLNDYYFSMVVKDIVNGASTQGLAASLSSLADGYDGVLRASDHLRDDLNTGVIIVGNISDKTLRIVSGNCRNCVLVDKPSRHVTSVYNDNTGGAFRVVSYLIRAGCSRIALIHGTPGHYFTRAMQRGYRNALLNHGLPFDPELCAQGDFHVQSGYEAMQALLDRKNPPDGLVSNDEMAVGAMRAIKERGLRIPADISVFGFDNLALSHQTEPALSTVALDYEYMALTAVRKIIENSKSDRVVPVRIVLPVRLVVRQSTRKPAETRNATG